MYLYRSAQAWNGGELSRRTFGQYRVESQTLDPTELADMDGADIGAARYRAFRPGRYL